MQAATIHRFGPPAVLQIIDVPEPTLRDDDVLVRVVASGVNPIEWKIRSGEMGRALGRPLPATLGWECSGVVERVGVEVTTLKAGDAVYAYPEFARDGTHAEKVAIRHTQLAAKPESLSFEQAAAVPMTAQAAWTAADEANVSSGQRVLVHGAGGSVGHWLIQLLRERGAEVAATASGADVARVGSLGAQTVIDYRERRFEELGEFDIVFDLVGGETQARSWAVIRRGGVLVSTTSPPDQQKAKAAGVVGKFVFTPPRGEILQRIGSLLDAGKLQPLAIGTRRTLADVSAVHEEAEAGRARGKTVLSVGVA